MISVPFDSPGIIAYYTVVRTGSRNEVEKGLSGFAHFFEHMMFRGTEKYSQEKYNDVLKSLGADSNAFTNDDWTCYHMTIPVLGAGHGRRDRGRPVPEPQVRRAVVPEGSAGSARRVQQERVVAVPQARRGDAEHGLHDTHLQAHDDRLSGRHQGHAQPVRLQQGLLRPLVPARELHDRRRRRREARRAGLAGQGSTTALEARGKASVEIPAEPPQTEPRSAQSDLAGADLADALPGLSHPGGRPLQPRHAALGALEQAVFGETSPLYRELVLKEQKVVTLMAEAEPSAIRGCSRSWSGCGSPRTLPTCGGGSPRPWPTRPGSPIDPARLEAIKSHLRYDFAGSLESADAVARTVGEAIAIAGRPEAINELYAAYDRLTPADLKRVAAAVLQSRPTRRSITLETEKQEMTTSHRLAIGLSSAGWPSTAILASLVPPSLAEAEDSAPWTRVLLPSPSSPLVAFRFVFRVGSQNDPKGKEGLAALTAAMVAEGGTKSL